MKVPTLAGSVAWLEDSIITLSGPLLAVSSIIAGVDVVTNNALAESLTWIGFAWAYCLMLTLDFQVLALGFKSHRVYTSSDKSAKRKVIEIGLAILIAIALAYVSVQMHAIYARVNGANVSIDVAQAQLGIDPIALIYERSALVLVLIFMSGWLRTSRPQSITPPSQADETIHRLVQSVEQLTLTITKVTTEHPAIMLPSIPERASSQQGGTDDERSDDAEASSRLALAYREMIATNGSDISASALALRAGVRKSVTVEWLRKQQESAV